MVGSSFAYFWIPAAPAILNSEYMAQRMRWALVAAVLRSPYTVAEIAARIEVPLRRLQQKLARPDMRLDDMAEIAFGADLTINFHLRDANRAAQQGGES